MNNAVKTAGLLGLMSGLFLAVGALLGGQSGMMIALGIAVVFNFGMYFFSDKMALAASKARPVPAGGLPAVERIVSSLAQRENMPMPSLHVIESPQPNAFATGRNPRHAAVAVTTGILELMNEAELEGVLAHELAHVKNRDILISSIAATIAAALSFMTRMAFWGSLGGRRSNDNNPLGAIMSILAIILVPIAAMLIQMAISRSREYHADASGADTTGSPLALASALRKLDMGTSRVPMDVNPAVSQLFIADPLKAFGTKGRGGMGGVAKRFSTHPPIEDRIQRLERMASGIR